MRPKAWTVLRLITNSKLERRVWLPCSWMAEKNRTCSGKAGRCRHFRWKAHGSSATVTPDLFQQMQDAKCGTPQMPMGSASPRVCGTRCVR